MTKILISFYYLIGTESDSSVGHWPLEVADRVCTKQKSIQDVFDQLMCQQLCLDSVKCVGIAYSKKQGNRTDTNENRCILCHDDNLTPSSVDNNIGTNDGFGFYRKPMQRMIILEIVIRYNIS